MTTRIGQLVGSDRAGPDGLDPVRRHRQRLAAIMIVGFALRVMTVSRFSGYVGFTGGDQADYLRLARAIAAGRGLGSPNPTAWRMPLYPTLLAPFARFPGLFGAVSLRSLVGTAQALIGTASIFATAALARTALGNGAVGRRVGLIAAGVIALWPPFVLMTAVMLSEQLFVLLLTAGMAITFGSNRRPAPLVVGCVLLGAAVLTRPIAVVPVAVAAVWALGSRPRSDRRLDLRSATRIVAVVALVMLPWFVRNIAQGIGPVPLTTSGGYTVCLGSSSTANAYEDDRAECGPVPGATEAESDRIRMWRAFGWKVDHPATEARLVGSRLAAMLAPERDAVGELSSVDDSSADQRLFDRLADAITVVHWIVAPFAIAGIVLLLRRRGPARWLVAATAGALLVPALGSVVPRYQEPIVPTLAVGVGLTFVTAWARLPRRASTRGHQSEDAASTSWVPMITAAIIVAVSALLLLAGVAGGHVLAVVAVAVAVASLTTPHLVDRMLARPVRGVESLASTVARPIARPLGWLRRRTRRQPPGSSPGVPVTSMPSRGTGLAGAAVVVVALAIAILAGLVWGTQQDAKDVASVDEFDLRGAPAVQVDGRIPKGDLAWNGYPVDGYAHEDEPFARDLFAELLATNNVRDSYLGVRNRDVTGNYVNIADGRRRTYTSTLPPEVVIWFFGGSTMFGIGQRDDHTIPSEVVRAAERNGVGVQAVNFGVNGDVRWQEALRFADALESDLPRPDLVVFYDGWNDLSLGQWRQSIGDDGTVDLRLPFNDDERDLQRSGRTLRSTAGPDAAAAGEALAAAQYRRTATTIQALADSERIPVLTFSQPIAVTKTPAPSDDELYERVGLSREFLPELAASYRRMLTATGVDVIDLTSALDDVRRPVYIDQGHTNELGARTIATKMYEHLRPSIRAVAG